MDSTRKKNTRQTKKGKKRIYLSKPAKSRRYCKQKSFLTERVDYNRDATPPVEGLGSTSQQCISGNQNNNEDPHIKRAISKMNLNNNNDQIDESSTSLCEMDQEVPESRIESVSATTGFHGCPIECPPYSSVIQKNILEAPALPSPVDSNFPNGGSDFVGLFGNSVESNGISYDGMVPVVSNYPHGNSDEEIGKIKGCYLVDGQHFLREILGLENHRFRCLKSSNGYYKLVSSSTSMMTWNLTFRCPYCSDERLIRNDPHRPTLSKKSSPSQTTPTSSQETTPNSTRPTSTQKTPPTSRAAVHLSLVEKAVWGMLSIGGGHNQMEEIFSTLAVKPPCAKTFRIIEHRLGEIWEEVLYDTMVNAGKEEFRLAVENEDVGEDGIPFITVVVDGGWSHRSHGHRFTANSGVACVIGFRTQKLLYIGVRNKYCSACVYRDRMKLPKGHANCFKNWEGPSASMEADMLVEAFKSSTDLHGLQYRNMIGDGDSSAFVKITQLVPYGRYVKKIECANHVIKNYTKRLYNIQKESKAIARKLPKGTIKRLSACARGAIAHNSLTGDVETLRDELRNGPAHVFGNHAKCKTYFCSTVGEDIAIGEELKTLIEKIGAALIPVVAKAGSIVTNNTNNAAESYMSLVAKFSGGKQVNRGKRGSFACRVKGAGLDYQLGSMWHHNALKSVTGRSPPSIVKKVAARRERRKIACRRSLHNDPRARHAVVLTKGKAKTSNGEEDYGPNCQSLDMDPVVMASQMDRLICRLSISSLQAAELEQTTRGQHTNDLWHDARKDRLTASRFGLIVNRRAKWAPVVESILYKEFTSTATNWGQINEKKAIQTLEQKIGQHISECGLFVDLDHGFLAATPDGVVDEDYIVEVKCPYAAREKTIPEAICNVRQFCLDKKTSKLKINHPYYYQIQGQLQISRRKFCHFGIWTTKDFHHEVISRDNDFWCERMLPKLTAFYKYTLLPEIVDPRKCRHMPIREKYDNNT